MTAGWFVKHHYPAPRIRSVSGAIINTLHCGSICSTCCRPLHCLWPPFDLIPDGSRFTRISHTLPGTIIIIGFHRTLFHLLWQQTPDNFMSAFPNCASLSNTWCWQRNETWEVWDPHATEHDPVWAPKNKSSLSQLDFIQARWPQLPASTRDQIWVKITQSMAWQCSEHVSTLKQTQCHWWSFE